MNRFRNKKNKKENADTNGRPSTDSDGPSMPTVKTSMTFRRGKKSQEEPVKPELDLSTALPSSDDFRTSLLMSGLSARFSMLREQDDPTSKIGKASDDSVLFPKRQSRMNDFGFQAHGLSDIAEVSSIHGSIRPPFAAFSRADSYNTLEGYGTDDDSQHSGSMMNRAKPGESNNLFGGRQKISMGNRTLYDNDVSQSAFQKIRKERQEKEEAERREREEAEAEAQAELSRPSSPPLSGYNKNRETSSTTSSGAPYNTRTSTAATSITSQRTPSLTGAHTPISPTNSNGLERSFTKTRRLYETGLDNHLHEQQSSAMSRLDTLTRQRTLGGHTPPSGPSPTFTGHPADRWGERVHIGSKGSMPNLRAVNPPTGPVMGFDFGVRQHNNTEPKPFGMASPPLSPPMSEYDVLTVQPNDRGKATALGAFAKPAQPYNDNKYSQRQLQMQQGRDTPPLRKHSPPTAFLPKQQPQPFPSRIRAESNATFASERSRSSSSVQRKFLPQDHMPETAKQVTVPEEEPGNSGTFFDSGDNSSVTSGPEQVQSKNQPKPLDLSHLYDTDQQISLERPPESQHPAVTNQL